MPATDVMPGSLAVRQLFEDLLGREVTVTPGSPLRRADLPTAVIAVFTDAAQQLYAVIGMQLDLAANAGAALGLLPPEAAQECVSDGKLRPALAENVFELCNVLTKLFNVEENPNGTCGCGPCGLATTAGGAHAKLYHAVFPGMPIPDDAVAQLIASGHRVDLTVDVARYGTGTFALTLAH